MKIKSLVIAGFFVLFCSLIKQGKPIKKADWLVGTWEDKTVKGNVYETYRKSEMIFG